MHQTTSVSSFNLCLYCFKSLMAAPHATLVLLSLFSIATTLNLSICKSEELAIPCNEEERMALLTFKHALTDPSHRLSSWSHYQKDCCKWTGVHCNNITGRVTKLDLRTPVESPYLELGGEISPALLELKSLSHLDLSSNFFVSTHIPIFLGSMESLVYINLSFSGLKGLIPYQLGNLSNLKYLDLGYNYDLHVDNLNWMSSLSSLKLLDFSWVDLHKQVDWFQVASALPSLLELRLENCQINTVFPPKGPVNFTSLQVLDLSNNNLNQKIPPCLLNLSISLQKLHLRSNFLQGEIQQTITDLQKLKILDLQGNQLEGRLLESLGQLKHLEEIDLSYNSFSGPIPSSLANLSSLKILNLGQNKLNGSIPNSFGFLQKLEGLHLGANSLVGGVPKILGSLSNLMTLNLGSNSLAGVVEEVNFLKLSELKQLSLSATNLFLSVNSSWVPPFQLEYLLLSSCRVGLSFPVWLKTQRSLKVLVMSKSGISDLAPNWFWNFTLQLEFLDLSSNQIRGDLSNVFLNSSTIILSSNLFKGQFPRVSPHVKVLNVANNSISGPISPFFCERVNGTYNLTVLDASNNLLSDELGHCWVHWQALMHLNLGRNNLSGAIPNSIGFLYALESLQLQNNGFSGYIPSTLQNCTALRFIDMGDNQISDTFPVWIWEMQNLMVLRLRSNRFKGHIAEKMCQLSSLIVLDLANNSLSGTIPKCLDNLKAMAGEDEILSNPLRYSYGSDLNYDNYRESLMLIPKGDELEYKDNLILVRMIDLSSNKLSGPIPPEISCLSALRFLNLSRNYLSGEIPKDMGGLKLLESLDLSVNHISGEIPQSLSDLSFLSYLNLSCNKLSGGIPTSTQLQSFDANSYIGNTELCGPPLTKNCTGEEELKSDSAMEQADEELCKRSEFYMGIGAGFAGGFSGVCSVLFFNKSWRDAYFQFLDHLKNLVFVKMVLKVRWVKAKLNRCFS